MNHNWLVYSLGLKYDIQPLRKAAADKIELECTIKDARLEEVDALANEAFMNSDDRVLRDMVEKIIRDKPYILRQDAFQKLLQESTLEMKLYKV